MPQDRSDDRDLAADFDAATPPVMNSVTGNAETVAEAATHEEIQFTHDQPDLSPPMPASLDPLAEAALSGPANTPHDATFDTEDADDAA